MTEKVIFSLGKSGTGKSTHSSLWLKHIPGTELLNDDNPILRLMPDGTARVYGSPWSGKTPCYKNKDVPAGAVVRIRQAPFNKIERLSAIQSYASLMASASGFRPFKELADGWHRTLEGLVRPSSLLCVGLACPTRPPQNFVTKPSMDKRTIANEILLEEAAALMLEGREVTLTPLGSSMLPFIRGGKDAVRLRKNPTVAVGDIILVRLPGRYVLHRLIRKEGRPAHPHGRREHRRNGDPAPRKTSWVR